MTERPLPSPRRWRKQIVGALALAFFSLVAAAGVTGAVPPGIGLAAFIGVVLASTYIVG
ncbi:MAG: hypothetical protein Q8R98_24495 [Rubrivivax sp.]|nr:hypothetical protein [Rubrivivax sp.]